MAKQRKEELELKQVRSEINRINTYYSGQLNNMDANFKVYILKKLADAQAKEVALMKVLGYV